MNEAKRFIDDYIYNNFIRKYNQPWDVIMTLVGNGYWNISLFPNKKSVIIQNTIWLRTNHQSINLFVYYLLKYKKREILELDIWAAQPSIKVWDLLSINITIPPLPEQKAIAGVLSSFDDKIELLRAENQTLEEMGQTLFKERFGKYKVGDELPDGWKVGKLGDIADIYSWKRPQEISENKKWNFKIPLIWATKIMWFVDDHLFEWKTLVIWRVGTHWIIQIFYDKIYPSDNTLVIKSDNFYFTYFILKHVDYERLNRWAVQPLITQWDLNNYWIILPTKDVLEKFNLTSNSIFTKIKTNSEEIESLSKTRDQLLPKLMSWEVRVKF